MNHTLIKLPNGGTAVDFTPQDSKEKAIVHLSVIQRLAKLLPKENAEVIIQDLIDDLVDCIGHRTKDSLERAITHCEDFVSFHRTVNLIAEYKPMPKVVGKINLDPDPEREEMMR